jgi:hypothetical protein
MLSSSVVVVKPQSWIPYIKKITQQTNSKAAAVSISEQAYPDFVGEYKRPRAKAYYDGITDALAIGYYTMYTLGTNL